jgi:hypothetical protein
LVSLAQTGMKRTPEQAFPVTSGPGAGDASLGAELVQPVFTRYWLHGKGPAPAGNLPVTVHLSPGRISLGEPGTPAAPAPPGTAAAGSLGLTVACGPEPASGEVTLDVPSGLAVTCADGTFPGPLRYGLPGRGHARWDLSVRALPGARPGRYFVAARIGDDLGQVLEDTALITIGEPPGPAPGLPRGELLAALEASQQPQTAEADVDLAPATLDLAPGGCATLTVRLANRTASVIRGESQLVSPFGSWCGTRGWTRGFTVGPDETVVLDYPVTLPPAARPGAHWWALAKVMYFGRVHYTECAEIRVTGFPS